MQIYVEKLSKAYDRPVLQNLELDIQGYSSIGIIGKSGCGKSTLLRLLSGIETGYSGTISINGMLLEEKVISEYHKSIGMVFQQHSLFPHLSLLKNISLILEKTRGFRGLDAEKKAKELLGMLHLEQVMHKRPDSVSGGQAQRVAIARALSTDPQLIFMDEPTAALDPILTSEVLGAVSELKKSGREFIFVTHEIRFVKQFADYVLFMDYGIIKEHGTVDILTHPKTKELSDFLVNENY
jgi:polar amino acid transport system ATP-binding protein